MLRKCHNKVFPMPFPCLGSFSVSVSDFRAFVSDGLTFSNQPQVLGLFYVKVITSRRVCLSLR